MPQQSVTQTYSITIENPLAITSPAPPDAIVGNAYSHQFTAANGVAPYSWSVVGGLLPAGLSLDAATGLLSGTPTTAGVFGGVQVQVSDAG